MSTKILLIIFAFGFLAGCSKDQYTSKPRLKYKNVNTTFLSPNQQLIFTIEVTDSEGDIQDSIWVQEVVKNCGSSGFTSRYKMPAITAVKDLKGDIEICYAYGLNQGCPPITHSICVTKNDTTNFRFWLKDQAKNVSDTITTEDIVISK